MAGLNEVVEKSMAHNLVSVVVPLFNRELLVKETIESLLAQTHRNWEMLIVDDGSEDASYANAESYAQTDNRIKLFKRTSGQKGVGTCRNIGIENATGDYIMFLDSDDLLQPEALENRLKFAGRFPELDYWIFKTGFFDHNTRDIIGLTPVDQNTALNQETVVHFFFDNKQLWYYTAAPLYRQAIFRSPEFRFDPRILSGQDKDFMAKILLSNFKFKLADHPEPDMLCRINSSTTTGLSLNKTFKRNYAEKAKFLRFHLENIRESLLVRREKVFTDYLNRTLLQIFNYELLASRESAGGNHVAKPVFKGESAAAFSWKRDLLKAAYFLKVDKMPRGYKLINAILA